MLQKLFPLGVVPAQARHVGEGQAIVGILYCGVIGVDSVRSFVGEGIHHLCGGFFAVHTEFGEGARPISAGQIPGDLAVFHIGKPGHSSGSIRGTGIPFAVGNSLCYRMDAAVDHLMRVAHQLDGIIARFQHIASRAFAVKGSHILFAEGNGQGFRFARIQQLGFSKARQHYVGFFDTALSVRRGVIHLGDVLAGYAPGVFHLHLHDNVPAAVHEAFDGLGERSVAQPIAEGILHGPVIINEAVRRGGFIVTVAHINTFRIFHIVALQVAIGEAASIVKGRSSGQIISIYIRQAAGRVHNAGQHAAHRIEAHRAGAAHPQAGVHAFNKSQFHGVGGVDEHDDLFILLTFHQVQQSFFVLGQFQIMPSVVCFAVTCGKHIHGQISALAANTRQNDDGCIGVFPGGFQQAVRVFLRGHLGGGEVGTGIATLLGAADTAVFVEIHKLFIHLQTGVGQALHHVHVGGGVAAAASCAAIDGVNGGVSEQVHLCSCGKGQRLVFIAQQHNAFFFQPLRHAQALFCGVGHTEDFRTFNRLFACQQRVQVHAHPGRDHGIEAGTGDVDPQRGNQQQRDGNQPSSFVGFHGFVSSLDVYIQHDSCFIYPAQSLA